MAENRLRLIKAFSNQPNKLLDKQRITNKDTLMYPVFQNALRGLNNIMNSSEKWVNENSNPQDREFYTYGNNILAFCGPRGQGKTSAMLSLTYALEHCNDSYAGNYFTIERGTGEKCYRLKEEDPVWGKTIDGREFLVMPPIDPTVLDKKESVVGLVLAWLLAEINEGWKKQNQPADFIEQKQVEVLQHFQKCRDCLALHSGVKERDLSALIKSSNILELKKHLYAIINCYFQLYGHSGKMHYLIIQLDDTDMDMVNAYDILEDTRKFLSLPQTVVLMATYLRQLRMLVAKHYEDSLALSHSSRDDDPGRADCMQMAAKYLDKLIPSQQMVHINSFRYQRDLNGRVKIGGFVDDLADAQPDNKASGKVTEADLDADLEEEFYTLIRKKTGLIFLKHGTYVNNILSNTLRGLVHLYQVLEKMETPQFPSEADYEKQMMDKDADYYYQYVEGLRVQQRNLILFEDYFRNDWCYNNLKEKDQEIMWAISQAHMAPKLRIIRNLLKNRWDWAKDWQGVSDFDTFSFTNMVMLLNEAEDRAESMDDLMLVFAIRTHLSIFMRKLYLSDNLETLDTKETAATFTKATPQGFEEGVYRLIAYKRLQSVVNYKTPSQQDTDSLRSKRKEIKEFFITLSTIEEKNNEEQLRTISIQNRLTNLYHLLFWNILIDVPRTKDAINKHKESFALQESVFNVLSNPDILRLYLSNFLDRFIHCARYVYKDNIPDKDGQILLESNNSIRDIFEVITHKDLFGDLDPDDNSPGMGATIPSAMNS